MAGRELSDDPEDVVPTDDVGVVEVMAGAAAAALVTSD